VIGSKDARECVQLGIVTRYRLDLDPASCALSECAIRDNASSTPWNAWRWLTVRATVPGLWGAVGPFVAVLVVVVATAIVTGFGAMATRCEGRRSGGLPRVPSDWRGGDRRPGPTLTAVGARLTAAQIKHALDDPRPPVPSYEALPPKQLWSVVAYLSSVKSAHDVIPVTGYLPSVPSTIPKRVVCSTRFYSTIVALFPAHQARSRQSFVATA